MSRFFRILTLLAVVLSCYATGYTEDKVWPLSRVPDLSSGFGDYRPNRFHAGIDLRTHPIQGLWVMSPVDGYVYRIKTSYTGSGKALYVMGDDGYQYVFYHLSRYEGPIQDWVLDCQYDQERFYLDTILSPDVLPVSEGQKIAVTGKTGTGAPHLHFEMREKNDVPINPLTHGYVLDDKVAPRIERLGLQLFDDHSLFSDGHRKKFFDLPKPGGDHRVSLDTVFYFTGPVGVSVDGFDMMRAGGMRQAIYNLALYIDGNRIFESRLDELDYGLQRVSGLTYDLSEVLEGRRRVRRLYDRVGHTHPLTSFRDQSGGLIGGTGQLSPGLHQAKVVAIDNWGNSTEVSFSFVWGESRDFYMLDSLVSQERGLHQFYLTAAQGAGFPDVDSVSIELYDRGRWLSYDSLTVEPMADGGLKVNAPFKYIAVLVFRFVCFVDGATVFTEPYFGFTRIPPAKTDASYEIVEDGLVVHLKTVDKYPSQLKVDLFDGDSLIGTEHEAQYFGIKERHVFIPMRPEYSRISKMVLSVYKDTIIKPFSEIETQIVQVGEGETVTLSRADGITATISSDNLWQPQFVGLDEHQVIGRSLMNLKSNAYTILPVDLVTRSDFDVQMPLRANVVSNSFTGLGWFDSRNDKWVWVDTMAEDSLNAVGGKSAGGGIFGAIADPFPPEIEITNLVPGRIVQNLRPTVEFTLTDSLSGIPDDRNIEVRMNKQWCLVEWDPETGKATATPRGPLSPGDCHVGVVATDRAGNKAEQYLIFQIVEGKK